MSIDLKDLGLTQEELIDRIVVRVASGLMYDDEEEGDSEFARTIQTRIEERVDQAVDNIALRNVLPSMEEYIETATLQATNDWGTPKGDPMTFVEYLVARAEAYMTEGVNYEGKTKAENRYDSWKKTQTRIAHMVDRHLHYSIETAMKNALQVANNAISEGIQEAVKIKLAEVVEKLKVEVKTK